jgi:hypothetical protein
MSTNAPLSKQNRSAAQEITGHTQPSAMCIPENPDTGDPTAIVSYLVNVRGCSGSSFEDIQALYTGSMPLTLEDLCDCDDLALTVDEQFVPFARFLGGDLYAKRDACEKAVTSTGDHILQAKWERQAALLEQNFPVSGIENITFGLRQKWIPSAIIVEFLAEHGFTVSVSPRGEFNVTRYVMAHAEFIQPLENYLNGRAINGSRKWEYITRLEDLETAFEEWMQNHPDIAGLIERYNRNFNNYKRAYYETGPLDIAEYLSGNIIPHPYQNAEARRLLDEGKGICAFGVGLGKTAMALSLAACGIKQKKFSRVCVVVPQSVLPTWQREAETLFTAAYMQKMIRIVPASSTPRAGAVDGFARHAPTFPASPS